VRPNRPAARPSCQPSVTRRPRPRARRFKTPPGGQARHHAEVATRPGLKRAEAELRLVEAAQVTVEFTSRQPLKFEATAPGLTEFLAKVHDTAPQVTVKPVHHLPVEGEILTPRP
jgi:hypothetical protein